MKKNVKINISSFVVCKRNEDSVVGMTTDHLRCRLLASCSYPTFTVANTSSIYCFYEFEITKNVPRCIACTITRSCKIGEKLFNTLVTF